VTNGRRAVLEDVPIIVKSEGDANMNEGVERLVGGHRDSVSVKRVFGEAYEKNGLTLIPAAAVRGAGGGGGGESEGEGGGRGFGTGYGLAGRPVGAYVVSGNEVRWQPAIDVNRIIAGSFLLAGLALLLGARRAK
jgi:uncharacterized spore protein YtfJ